MANAPSPHSGPAQKSAATEPLRGPGPRAMCTGRRLRSTDLFGSQQEVEIEHGPAVYRLRLTSLGKLILTK
ncbi:MAG TPA: hemin uptake protein HemP [Rubrivivax sp.]